MLLFRMGLVINRKYSAVLKLYGAGISHIGISAHSVIQNIILRPGFAVVVADCGSLTSVSRRSAAILADHRAAAVYHKLRGQTVNSHADRLRPCFALIVGVCCINRGFGRNASSVNADSAQKSAAGKLDNMRLVHIVVCNVGRGFYC